MQGRASKEIADQMNLSVRTVEKHRANAMEKLRVRELASFVRICIQLGVVSVIDYKGHVEPDRIRPSNDIWLRCRRQTAVNIPPN